MSGMSMRVETTLAAEALTRTRMADRAGATALRSSFATALTGATGGTSATTGGRSAGSTTGDTAGTTATKAPKGEKTRAVEGKDYVEIISGPRNGMFVNRSGNGRDGEAFVRVEKDGRDVHIYGSGKDRHTVVMWHNDDKSPTAGADRVPEGEVSAPVEGKLYDEITAGPRNGMFINRSGNIRDGLPFVLVKHDHSEDHVYGSGNERQVIRVWDEGYEPTPAATQPGTTGSR
jgi:hypothetical protein